MDTVSTDSRRTGTRSTLGRVLDGSATVTLSRWITRRVESLSTAVSDPLERSYSHSSIHRFAAALVRATRHSQTYRWLTKEPQHGVIVVDLRETRAVGPIFGPLDWLASTWPARRITRATTRLTSTVDRTVRHAPVRFASVAVLGLATAVLAVTWSSAGTGFRLAGLAVLAVAAVGLRIDASWEELAQGRLGDAARAVFDPPALEERADDEQSP